MNKHAYTRFPLTLLAAAITTTIAPLHAADDEDLDSLTRPQSTVSFGLGYLTSNNTRFGQYRGLTDDGIYGALDLNLVTRDDDTGTWMTLDGRNLGLDNRELRFEQQRQGDWRYSLDFNQTQRVDPFTVNTGLTGIGSNNLVINGTGLRDRELEMERQAIGLGGRKELGSGYAFEVKFRNEEKDGERIFGRGTTGGAGNFEFLAEPINSTTQQWEAILSYTGKAMQWAAGYYGTRYDNADDDLNVTGGGALAGFTPIGLPPDNQSHQGYLSGSYSFTPTTIGNFKVAYGRATQNDSFILPAFPGNTDLDGRIDTTQLALGLTSRPMPKLSLRANVRYDDRDDKTPVRDYTAGTSNTFTGENEPRSITTTGGKLEASYLLPSDFRLTGSVDYEQKERSKSDFRVVSHRDRTEEYTYRAELRRGMSETLNGAVALIHSERGGSGFETTIQTNLVPYSNEIAPIHMADRDRNQVRLMLDWVPLEPLSLQFVVDNSWDDYDQRTANKLGPLKGSAQHFAVDAAYQLAENLQATAWYSYDVLRADQASSSGGRWVAKMRETDHAFGVGLRGKPMPKLEMGADVQYSRYRSEFDQESAVIVVPSIPDVTYRHTMIGLYAKYQLQKNAGVRLDFTHDRMKTNDWAWTNWVYTDGTTLSEDPRQSVSAVAVTYYYKFQ